MHILAIDHIQLTIPPGAEHEARELYGSMLGLREVQKPEALASRGGCWFRGGKAHLHLGVQQDFTPASMGHPAFIVSDLESMREKLEQAGIDVRSDRSVPGRKRFYINDPFGNRLEFMQEGDGFSQRA